MIAATTLWTYSLPPGDGPRYHNLTLSIRYLVDNCWCRSNPPNRLVINCWKLSSNTLIHSLDDEALRAFLILCNNVEHLHVYRFRILVYINWNNPVNDISIPERKCCPPDRGPLWGEVMVPVWSTPPKRASSGVFVGAWWCWPWCPRLPVPTAGLLLGVWVCWAGPRWWKWPLSEPEPMVPSRLMERWPGSLGLLLPAPMCRPGKRESEKGSFPVLNAQLFTEKHALLLVWDS